MGAKFLIRLDDASPFMDVNKWERIETLFDKYNIQPIVAIIPDNKDDEVTFSDYRHDFWEKARRWQDKGWTIALHGYDHCFISKEKGLVPRNSYSEFAGVDSEIQEEKIKNGYNILVENGLKPTVWVAPAHSFDKNSLKAINKHTPINIVSDGLAIYPFKKLGFNWIPQQVCHVPRRKLGLWTVCLHPNNMSPEKILKLERRISETFSSFISIRDIKYSFIKGLVGRLYFFIHFLRRLIKL